MSVWIKNNDTVTHNYQGQDILTTEYFEIDNTRLVSWANDSQLLSDIGSTLAIVAKDDSGSTNITDINEAINYLKGSLPSQVNITQSPVFAYKASLFFRGRGVKQTITANSTESIIYTMTYAKGKINGLEVFYGNNGDTCNFKVLDTTTGTYTAVPNYLLNQFGFDWNVDANGLKEILPYDADLLLNMQLVVEYTNNSNVDTEVGVNFYIHEDKS